jgi:hypothetical protein
MTLQELHKYSVEKAKQHPQHFVDIHSFYDLAEMEVQSGSSESHECDLALNDIEELISTE